MIVKNRLLNFDSIIYQNDEWFKFSLDSVLLVNFINIPKKKVKIFDLATGNAPIPMLLTYKTDSIIYGIELQKCIYDLGIMSINENNMSNQIKLINDDIKNIKSKFDSESFDIVITNPPYFKYIKDSSIVSENDVKKIARHEVNISIDDILNNAKYLLNNKGSFYMVHRTERFIEIINKLSKLSLEPKRVQFIYSKEKNNSDLFLIECKKNGKSGLKILPPLVVGNNDGSYKENIRKMYSL